MKFFRVLQDRPQNMKKKQKSSQQSKIADHAVSRFACFYFFSCFYFQLGFIITYCLQLQLQEARGIHSKFNNPISTYPQKFVFFPIESAMKRKNCC